MNYIYRATRQGFVESISLAGALTLALAKGAHGILRVIDAYMHHRSPWIRQGREPQDAGKRNA